MYGAGGLPYKCFYRYVEIVRMDIALAVGIAATVLTCLVG